MDDAVGWLVALGFCFFTFRYFFGADSSSSGSSSSSRRTIPQASVDQVAAMFPNIPEGSIRYALEGARGNVESVVERALRQGGLPEPPAGFFQDPATSRPAAVPPPAPATAAASTSPSAPPSSLIARLGLQGRTSEEVDEPVAEGKGKGKAAPAWETTMEARERSLKERKARMVLEARRKLLEKEKAKAAAKAGAEVGSAVESTEA